MAAKKREKWNPRVRAIFRDGEAETKLVPKSHPSFYSLRRQNILEKYEELLKNAS